MQKVNVREARRDISRLLDAVAGGEEIVIVRRGKPVARLLQVEQPGGGLARFPEHTELRAQLPPQRQSSAAMLREMRDERG
ncbi:type II toxin-antitoxin system Phd/YefM family antitoxin [Desulfurivibrio dismutans]|uniref:type II toxin-antitoxin system Phd/YefM family antitoxin n=1 Tax=Desulfurivibrio dismutans TaxID=1398908 RepID=UPI0023DCA7BE|nr:type II toxin-antitoxin system prevent-host-death family antitoxin [Desulfurivibrio alkaliphilus]MDF1614367.1 type II toxin-antitoxin system prevent-host-death family antitoxin [Desulfurivibrio alkaliphilus]